MRRGNWFALSWPLMWECFKMYWYIPALSFVLYFFIGVFPLLSHISNIGIVDYYIQNSLNNGNLIYVAMLCVVPIVVALLVMGFLHNEPKAVMLHAMPLSKNRIFNSYYWTGWILCQLPVVMMALIYMLIMSRTDAVGIGDVLYWLFSSAAMITYFYGIAVLSGSLTGTTAMNLFTAGVIMVIVPVIVKILNGYFVNFVPGYYELPDWMIEIAEKSNPLFALLFRREEMDYKLCVIYLLTGICISILAKIVYKTRKLEIIGNSMLSKVFEEICTYLIAFVGMSAFGMFAWSFGESKLLIVTGMAAGAVITFFIVKLVVSKGEKVINRNTIRSMIIYVCLAAVFIAVMVFDITGNTNRIPAVGQVESVELRGLVTNYDSVNMAYGQVPEEYADMEPELTSPETIEMVTELHENIIENKLYDSDLAEEGDPVIVYDAGGNEGYVLSERITIKYHLKNGRDLNRAYDIYIDEKAAELIDNILTSQEYKEKTQITSYVDMDKISYITLTGMYVDEYAHYDELYEEIYYGSMTVIDDKAEIERILTAWQTDVSSGGYLQNNRYITPYSDIAVIEIHFVKGSQNENQDSNSGRKEKKRYDTDMALIVNVTDMDENTINCLINEGYGQSLGVQSNE